METFGGTSDPLTPARLSAQQAFATGKRAALKSARAVRRYGSMAAPNSFAGLALEGSRSDASEAL